MLAVLAAAAFLLLVPAAYAAPVLPAGFQDQLVTSGVTAPSALAFTPDGRMLIAARAGTLHIYKNGGLLATPALDISAKVCQNGERGLLGAAVHPAFATNNHIYLYYTFEKFGVCSTNSTTDPVNRVSRFTLGTNDTVDPASEVVLIDNIPSPNSNHNGGDLQFGKDGYLYISVGDGGCDYAGGGCAGGNDAARDRFHLLGKILRITGEGDIPPTNPYRGAGTARCNVTGFTSVGNRCQETFAWGLRNPFRIAFDSDAAGTVFHINDVGQATWEEIDLGQAGADYGWNIREGPCANGSGTNCGPPPAGMTNPIHWYRHDAGGCFAITGGAFVPLGIWPSEYDNDYLYQDLTCGKLFKLRPVGAALVASEFGTGFNANSLIGMTFGPNGTGQALYYYTYNAPGNHVRRIVYTGTGNRSPTARMTANPAFGNLPLTVNFNGTTSTDPDGDPLTYDWDFGDGTAHGSGATTPHTYMTAGTYTARLTVTDGRGGQDTDTIRIDAGNNPPNPQITAPSPTKLFRVGEQITLSGTATDPEDGTLPVGALSFEVIRHHGTSHTHPFLPPTQGSGIQITAPPPEDFQSTTTSKLEIRLTATDSRGLSRTISQDLNPKLVNLTFATQPGGLVLVVDGVSVPAPRTFTSWEAAVISVNAPDQSQSGAPYGFVSWSDGGDRAHVITTPASPTTYTAAFVRLPYRRPQGGSPLRVPLVPAMRPCTSPNSTHGGGLPTNQSCSNPQPVSTTATLGRSANQFARAGFAKLVVCTSSTGAGCGGVLAATAPDVKITGNGSDVVCRAGADARACPGGAGSDYDPNPVAGPYTNGNDIGTNSNRVPPSPVCNPTPPNPQSCAAGADMTALAEIPASSSPAGKALRVTDSFNGTPSAGDPPGCAGTTSCSATVVDAPFAVPVVCRATPSAAIGSYCGVGTTADALVPGVIQQGRAAIIELGQIRVLDAGPDGVRTNADDQLFAVQGIFVP